MTSPRLAQAVASLSEGQVAAALVSARNWGRPIPPPDDVDRVAAQIEGWASRPWSTDSSSVSISALGVIASHVEALTRG